MSKPSQGILFPKDNVNNYMHAVFSLYSWFSNVNLDKYTMIRNYTEKYFAVWNNDFLIFGPVCWRLDIKQVS